MLLEEQIVNKQSVGPNVDLRTIGLFSKQFRRHEYRGAYYLFVDLFFDCESKISQFVESMNSLLLDEDVVRLNVPVDDLAFGNELQSSRKLIGDFEGFLLAHRSSLGNDVF